MVDLEEAQVVLDMRKKDSTAIEGLEGSADTWGKFGEHNGTNRCMIMGEKQKGGQDTKMDGAMIREGANRY